MSLIQLRVNRISYKALELTNGVFFNDILEEGAHVWLKRYKEDSKKIIDGFFQSALNRAPSKAEENIMLEILGSDPKPEQLQDVFWAVLLSPEFQFVN